MSAAFKATKETHDHDDQDSHNPNATAWDMMTNYYNEIVNNDLNLISPNVFDELVGKNVPSDYPSKFDKLTSSNFKEVVTYLNVHYRKARNMKTQKSGHHGGIAAHCQGKIWIVYYHALLQVEGNTELGCFAFPELPPDVI